MAEIARIIGEAGIEITPEEGTFASDLGRELERDVERAARGVDVPPIEVGLEALADELRGDVMREVRALESIVHVNVPVEADGGLLRDEVTALAASVSDGVTATVPVEPEIQDDAVERMRGPLRDSRGRYVRANVPVTPELDDSGLGGVRTLMGAKLRAISQELKLRVGVEIDRDKLAGFAAGLGSAALSAGKFTVAGLAASSAAASLGTVLGGLLIIVTQLSGGLVVLPGILAGILTMVAAVKIGASGVGEALSLAFDPSKAAEFEQAIAKLAPSAQATVRAIQAMGPAFTGLKLDVQERLFAGLGERISAISEDYLPMAQRSLGGVASAFNAGAASALDYLNTTRAMDSVEAVLTSTEAAAWQLSPAFADGADGLLSLAGFGAQYLPALAGHIAFLIDSFRDWVEYVGIGQGVLASWVSQAGQVFSQLGQVAGNVGSILGSIWDAAGTGAGGFLGNLVMLTGQLATFLQSAEGVQLLSGIFGGISAAAAIFRGILAQLLPALAPIAQQLPGMFAAAGPGLLALAAGIGNVLRAAAPLLPVIGTLVGALGSALGSALQVAAPLVSFLASALAFLAPVLGPLVAGLAGFAGALAAMVGVAMAVSKVLTILRVAWMILNLAFVASPIGFVIALVVGLVAALIYCWQNFEGFRNVVTTVWNAILSAGQAAIGWLMGLPGMIGSALSAAGAWFAGLGQSALDGVLAVGTWLLALPGMVIGWLAGLGAAIASGASAAWTWLVTAAQLAGTQLLAWLAALPGLIAFGLGFLAGMVFNAAVAAWNFLWNTLPLAIASVGAWLLSLPGQVMGWLAMLGSFVASAATAAWTWLVTTAAVAIAAAIAWVAGLPGQVAGWLAGLGATVAAGATAAWVWLLTTVITYGSQALAWVGSLPGRVGSFLASLPGIVLNAATSAWRGFLSATTSGAQAALSFIGSLPGRIMGFFAAAGSWLVGAGRAIVEGLWNGLKSMADAVLSWISDLGGRIADGFKAAVGIASPSKVFAGFGVNIGQGLIVGMEKIGPDVIASARQMADDVRLAAADPIADSGMELGQTLGASITDGLMSTRPAIIATAQRLADGVRSAASGPMIDAAREILAQMNRGGAVFEDLTFRGASRNVGDWNDELLNRMELSGARDQRKFLEDLVRGGSASAAPAQITNHIYTRDGQSPKQIADETSRAQAFALETGTSSLVGAI